MKTTYQNEQGHKIIEIESTDNFNSIMKFLQDADFDDFSLDWNGRLIYFKTRMDARYFTLGMDTALDYLSGITI